MAWDFSTDPEFQEKLDWVEDFCENEIEPFDLVFPYAIRTQRPGGEGLVEQLQDQSRRRGSGRSSSTRSSVARATASSSSRCSTRSSAATGSAPAIFGCQAPDTGNMEILAAYGTDEQKKRGSSRCSTRRCVSAYSMTEPAGRVRPQPVQDGTPYATATSGSSTARSGSPAPAATPTSSS